MLVIFDCDGVLVDSEILSAEVLLECFKSEGLARSFDDVLETYRGKSVPDCVLVATQELATLPSWQGFSDVEITARGTEFWHQMQAKTLDACATRLRAIPNVKHVLDGLVERGIDICVASNGKHEKMQVTLPLTGLLDYFGTRIFSYEDVRVGKPAPDLFLYAAKTLGATPTQTLVIEDSLTGIRAALAANMKPFAYCPADHNGQANPLLPEVISLGVEHFTDMAQLLSLIDREAVRIGHEYQPA